MLLSSMSVVARWQLESELETKQQRGCLEADLISVNERVKLLVSQLESATAQHHQLSSQNKQYAVQNELDASKLVDEQNRCSMRVLK